MKEKTGITLIELLIVMSLLTVVFSLSLINLTNLPASSALSSTQDLIVSDLKFQQLKALSGNSEGSPTGSAYGVFFGSTSYTLFRGLTYQPGDSGNFVVNLEPTLSFGDVSYSDRSVVFSAGSGEIVVAPGSISLLNAQAGEEKIIRLNKYGATY